MRTATHIFGRARLPNVLDGLQKSRTSMALAPHQNRNTRRLVRRSLQSDFGGYGCSGVVGAVDLWCAASVHSLSLGSQKSSGPIAAISWSRRLGASIGLAVPPHRTYQVPCCSSLSRSGALPYHQGLMTNTKTFVTCSIFPIVSI